MDYNYKTVNDYELLYMISDNNDDSLEFLFEKYKPFINRKLSKWKAKASRFGIDLEDLEQEINLALVSAVNSFNENNGTSFYTYLNVVLERRIVNVFRNQSTCKNRILLNTISLSTPINEDMTISDILADNGSFIDEIVYERELNMNLSKFCYELPIGDAMVFEMFLSGYNREVISELLEIPIKRISYLLCKIRKKSKQFLLNNELFVI